MWESRVFIFGVFWWIRWIHRLEQPYWESLSHTSGIGVGSYLIYFSDNRSPQVPWVRDTSQDDLMAYLHLHALSRGIMGSDCVLSLSDGFERHGDSVHRWRTHCAWWRSYLISEKGLNEFTPHWQPRRIFWRQDSQEDTAYRQDYPHMWRQKHRM